MRHVRIGPCKEAQQSLNFRLQFGVHRSAGPADSPRGLVGPTTCMLGRFGALLKPHRFAAGGGVGV